MAVFNLNLRFYALNSSTFVIRNNGAYFWLKLLQCFQQQLLFYLKKSHCLDFQTKTEQHWTLFEPGLLNARGSVR